MAYETTLPAVAGHGAHRLPSVLIDSYNLEINVSSAIPHDRARGFRRSVMRVLTGEFGNKMHWFLRATCRRDIN